MRELREDGEPGSMVLRCVARVASVTLTLERRLMYLIVEGGRGAIPFHDLTGELALMARDLRRCYRQLAEVQGRRDLDFNATLRVEELDRRCLWLYRKANFEHLFFSKLHLEAELRSFIPPEAFEIYEELTQAEERERQLLSEDDQALKTRMLDESQSDWN